MFDYFTHTKQLHNLIWDFGPNHGQKSFADFYPGDAYIDHPSFGMAIVGRVLEAQGFRVGILSQPDWTSPEPFKALGRPNLFFGITAGNMDSMVNRYTSDRRVRSDDAYTPGGLAGKRPDRSVIVYAQRAREAYPDVPVVVGGIIPEADALALKQMGVKRVYTPKDYKITQIMGDVVKVVEETIGE